MSGQTRTLIMAVPWEQTRARRAIELHRQTDGELVWDEEHNAWATWLKVLRTAGRDAVVILEDDVTLAEGWRDKIEAAVTEHGESVIQFFSMRQADLTVGSRWEPGRTFMMNQCYYLPAGAAEDLIGFALEWHKTTEHRTGYDICMAEWMKARGMKYWLHVPSLVQHETWASEINPRRPRNRQSKTFEMGESA